METPSKIDAANIECEDCARFVEINISKYGQIMLHLTCANAGIKGEGKTVDLKADGMGSKSKTFLGWGLPLRSTMVQIIISHPLVPSQSRSQLNECPL